MKRMFFSADAHGSNYVWRKWVNVPGFHKADILLLCGDLTGKALIPLIEQNNGTWTSHYFGRKWTFRSEDEMKDYERRIGDSGAYSFRTDPEEIKAMQQDKKLVDEKIFGAIGNRIREWMDFLIEKVDTKKVQCMAMPGNDDDLLVDDIIKSYEDKGIIWPLDRVVEIAGFETISCEYVNPTPWDTPRELKEKDLKKKLEDLFAKVDHPERAILNTHAPPYGTRLDFAPKLKNLKPVIVAGTVEMEHVGSKAVREVIEEYQPMIGLHGHIHESYAKDKIGNTPVVNPGSEYGEGILRGFIIDFSDTGVENYYKVEG